MYYTVTAIELNIRQTVENREGNSIPAPYMQIQGTNEIVHLESYICQRYSKLNMLTFQDTVHQHVTDSWKNKKRKLPYCDSAGVSSLIYNLACFERLLFQAFTSCSFRLHTLVPFCSIFLTDDDTVCSNDTIAVDMPPASDVHNSLYAPSDYVDDIKQPRILQ